MHLMSPLVAVLEPKFNDVGLPEGSSEYCESGRL